MEREIVLDPIEARVLGVLIEKSVTTPEQYPLSINAATAGANQRSNREPVLSLSDEEVGSALRRLEQRYLARKVFLPNSRVEKYAHNGKEALGLEAPALAVLAELLLRGPQTAGELRAHASRMAPIESLEQLMSILGPLLERGLARRLPPAPGSRADRYVQLLSPDAHPIEIDARPGGAAEPTLSPAVPSVSRLLERVETLEMEVDELRRHIQTLARRTGIDLEE